MMIMMQLKMKEVRMMMMIFKWWIQEKEINILQLILSRRIVDTLMMKRMGTFWVMS